MSFRYMRRYAGPLKAVILDWAGTTVDFGCFAPAAAFQAAFAGRGVPITVAEARAPMGLPKWHHIKQILAGARVAEAWTAVTGAGPSDADVDALYADFLPVQIRVAAEHARVIPGVVEAIAAMRGRGLRIGSTTGYPGPVMAGILTAAATQGYQPELTVCAGDTKSGRPGPAMALKCVIDLDISPVAACVKIGDTPVDVEEGLNAGMWTIGVTETGNEVGVSAADWAALAPEQRRPLAERAAETLHRAGAHFVVPSVAAVLPVLDEIERRLSRGEQP